MISLNHKLARALAAASAAGLLSACSVTGGSDVMSIYTFAKEMISGDRGVSLQEAAAVPYASVGVRVGSSNQIMLVLATEQGGQRLWTSAARIALTTQNGRIMRTAGLGQNLAGYELKETRDNRGVVNVRWHADFPELGIYSVSIACTDKIVRDETIVILGAKIHARRVDETCKTESEQIHWSFDNRFWIDAESQQIWRSIQHVNPRLDAIEIEVLRPPE